MKLLIKIIWLILMAALLAAFGYHAHRKFTELQELKRRQMTYETRIRELQSRVVELTRELADFQTNPQRLEEVARERLGLVGEDERIFIFEAGPTPGSR